MPRDSSFRPLHRFPSAFGDIALLQSPGDPGAVDEVSLAALHPAERELAEELIGFSRHDFVAGRLAARQLLGTESGPVLRGDGGEPLFPHGWRGSISHKRTLAAALAARGPGPRIGLDIERLDASTRALETRVATAAELERLPTERNLALIAIFAIKEATYKALWPNLRRFIAFHEAEVALSCSVVGPARVELRLPEGSLELDATVTIACEHVVATVAHGLV